MGSSSGQTSTTKSEPWDGQKPYTLEGYQGAQDLYKKGPAQYYQGQTVAGFGPQSIEAQNQIWNRATSKPAYEANAQSTVANFAGGQNIDNASTDKLRYLAQGGDFNDNPVFNNLGALGANGSNIAANANNRIGDLTTNGGNVAGYSRGVIGDITQSGGGSNSQIRNDTRDLITGQAQAANPAFAQLQSTANGNYLNSNPYLDQMYGKAAKGMSRAFAEGTAPGIDSQASQAGRYGSGMHANIKDAAGQKFGQSLSDLATSIYGGNYATERQNQLGAANTLGSQYLQGQGLRASTAATSADQASRDAALRLQATGQISGDMSGDLGRRLAANQQITSAEGQDVSNQLAANQQLSQGYQSAADRMMQALNMDQQNTQYGRAQMLQAAGMAPQLQQMDYTNLNNASAVGSANDNLRQQQINADMAKWDFNQNADWQNLSRYLAAINGGSPNASVSTQTNGTGMSGLASLFAGAGGLGQLAMGTRGLLW